MKTKKIILFIVEGITDKTALGLVISNLFKEEEVQFRIVNGDITSNYQTEVSNIIKKLNQIVNEFRGNVYKTSDILKIVHLVDVDGVYIDQEHVNKEVHGDQIKYTKDGILTNNPEAIIKRNEKKSMMLDKLSNVPKINKIDYNIYYFSTNLDQVLYNEQNLPDREKMEKAEKFEEKFYGREKEFLEFMNSIEFKVSGDYGETWEFIKIENNSLSRKCNFHLFFNEPK